MSEGGVWIGIIIVAAAPDVIFRLSANSRKAMAYLNSLPLTRNYIALLLFAVDAINNQVEVEYQFCCVFHHTHRMLMPERRGELPP
jgi:hypothetical protein